MRLVVLCLQWELSQAISSFDDVKFESASVLAQLFEQQQQQKWAKEKLRRAIEISQGNCYWHCRLLFQLAVSDAADLAAGVGRCGLGTGIHCSPLWTPRLCAAL